MIEPNSIEIRQALAEILQVQPDKLPNHAVLAKDLNIDSLDLVELVIDVENRFGIRIVDEDIDKLITVGDLINRIATSTPLQAADAA